MVEVKAIVRPERLESVLHAVREVAGVGGVTVSKVEGFGRQQPPRADTGAYGHVVMAKVETVILREAATSVVEAITAAAFTGRPGDGKVFVLPVETVIDIHAAQGGGSQL